MLGISFMGKHSYKDFGVTMAPGKEIGLPSKEKIKVKVPFSNVEYDFSRVYGEETYSPRPLSYPFNIAEYSKANMNTKKTAITNWLMNSNGKQKLYDDAFPGYYFLAEVESNPTFEEDNDIGILKVSFEAYPFMIAELEEGNDIWDSFNFELDVAQTVDFEVNGSLDVALINGGTPSVSPIIKASSEMSVLKDGITYNFPSGETNSKEFRLFAGENDLKITGNGTISFVFHKELI